MRRFFFLSLPAPFLPSTSALPAPLWVHVVQDPLVPVRIQFSESVHCWGKCQCGFRGDAVPVFTSYYYRFVCPNTLLETMRRPRRPKHGHNLQNCQKRQRHLTKTRTSLKNHEGRMVGDDFLSSRVLPVVSYTVGPKQHKPKGQKMVKTAMWKGGILL